MATTTTGHPGRTLIVLAVLVAGLITLMAVSGTWVPKLGLDLQGGTTITLTAQNTSGTGTVDPNSLQQAKTIIQNRVDSLGVGESEVTTAGDKQLIVTVPNVQRDELVQLVGQTAVLRFRAVLAAEQVAPPVTEPVPTETGSPAPSEEPTASASAEPTPPTAGTTQRRRRALSRSRPRPNPATTDPSRRCPRRRRSRPARPACRPTARASRPTRPWSGSRTRPARPPSPSSPAIRSCPTSPISRCSPATGRAPRSTCSDPP